MHPYPHVYTVSAAAQAAGEVKLSSPGIADLPSMPPPEFDGPGGYWRSGRPMESIRGCDRESWPRLV